MNQRLFKHTWVATLLSAVMLSGLMACTSEENITKEPTTQEGPTYKVSIAATIGNEAQTRADAPTKAENNNGWEFIDATPTTRAVSYNSTTGALESRFLTTDNISVYNSTINAMGGPNNYQYTPLHPDADGKTANITGSLTFHLCPDPGELTEVAEGNTLRFIYNKNGHLLFYYSQLGTLANLNNYDYALADVTIEGISGDKNNGYTLTTSKASFVNAQSMFKFTFTGLDEGTGVFSLTLHSAKKKLVYTYQAKDNVYTYDDQVINLTDAARAANGPGVVYAALRFAAIGEGETDDITLTVMDTNHKNHIVKKASPVGGFQNGKFYSSTIDLSDNSANVRVLADGETLTGSISGASQISIADGASVTLNGVTISSSAQAGIVCKGSATITLVGTNNVSSSKSGCAGIQAGPAGSTLTIQGSGLLTATGASNGAGIGSGQSTTCGNIVIAGGTVSASGGVLSAGIGTGGNGSYCGNITISGGTVVAIGDPASTAAGDSGGAGIGSGGGCRSSSDGTVCGKITITGGTVTATGGSGCAGIGSGTSYDSDVYTKPSSCGDIEISGGTVIANGGYQAAGIGSGVMDANNKKYTHCGNILISGGTVTATGGVAGPYNAIAIGSGKNVSGSVEFYCGTITITEGITKIVANNEYGPARPVGTSTTGNDCGSVTIDGVTVIPHNVPQEYTYEHLKLTNNGHKIYTIQP